MSLPVVNREVAQSVLAKFRWAPSSEGLDGLRERYARENPDLVEMVDAFASGWGDPEVARFAAWAGFFAVALVESQGQADELARELEGRIQ